MQFSVPQSYSVHRKKTMQFSVLQSYSIHRRKRCSLLCHNLILFTGENDVIQCVTILLCSHEKMVQFSVSQSYSVHRRKQCSLVCHCGANVKCRCKLCADAHWLKHSTVYSLFFSSRDMHVEWVYLCEFKPLQLIYFVIFILYPLISQTDSWISAQRVKMTLSFSML